MILNFLLIILIAGYLKRTFQTAENLPGWDKIFTYIFIASIGLTALTLLDVKSGSFLMWIAHAMLLFILYILFTKKEFSSAGPYMIAIAPYIFISLANDIIKLYFRGFYIKWEEYFVTAMSFSIIWLIAMFMIHREQQKALENSLNELRITQAQLMQCEKMATLGDLTAGIAHEIQNPLNFVNNFSEVNKELLLEMNEDIGKGNITEAKKIADNVLANEEKIIFHGKRAGAIVKSMLLHSRKDTGVKEPTDINALVDEFFRLAYHGLRAKDKSFNVTMKTDFDESIGNINIIPQDIGRVILNLINNAFYAVTEKKNASTGSAEQSYEPTVSVSTKKINGMAEIIVKDNGNGIPQNISDKIFQPFFTTKPTGQGTGLGLSMSYEIVTKGHGGELTAENLPGRDGRKEAEGSQFIIHLPV